MNTLNLYLSFLQKIAYRHIFIVFFIVIAIGGMPSFGSTVDIPNESITGQVTQPISFTVRPSYEAVGDNSNPPIGSAGTRPSIDPPFTEDRIARATSGTSLAGREEIVSVTTDDGLDFKDRDPADQKAYLQRMGIWLERNSPVQIVIKNNVMLRDNIFREFAKLPAFSGLQNLILQNTSLTEESLFIFSRLPNLIKLNLSHNADIIHFATPRIWPWLFGYAAISLLKLTELSLEDCTNLKEIKLDAPKLQTLKINGNPKLATLSLAAPILRHMDVTDDILVTDNTIYNTYKDSIHLMTIEAERSGCRLLSIIKPHYIGRMVLINLSDQWIGDIGVQLLTSMLKHNRTVRSLILSNVGMDNIGGMALADMLETNTTIRELDISHNQLGGRYNLSNFPAYRSDPSKYIIDHDYEKLQYRLGVTIRHLCSLSSGNLKKLILNDTGLLNTDLECIANSRILENVEDLNLQNNFLGSIWKWRTISGDERLTDIDYYISGSPKDGLSALARSRYGRSLRYLTLNNNKDIEDSCMQAMAASEMLSNVSFIDLTGTAVSTSGIASLTNTPTLVHLQRIVSNTGITEIRR